MKIGLVFGVLCLALGCKVPQGQEVTGPVWPSRPLLECFEPGDRILQVYELPPSPPPAKEELGPPRIEVIPDSQGSIVLVPPKDIREFIVPALQALLSYGTQVAIKDGSLHVRATVVEHERVARLLDGYRKTPKSLFEVTATFYRSSRDLWGAEETRAARLSAREADAALDVLRADSGFTRVEAPRLNLGHGQAGSFQITNQVAFVKEYEVQFSRDGKSSAADPVIDTVKLGVYVALRPVILDSKKTEVLLEGLKIQIAEDPHWERGRHVEQSITALGVVEFPKPVKYTYALATALEKDERLLVGPITIPSDTSRGPRTWIEFSCRALEEKK